MRRGFRIIIFWTCPTESCPKLKRLHLFLQVLQQDFCLAKNSQYPLLIPSDLHFSHGLEDIHIEVADHAT